VQLVHVGACWCKYDYSVLTENDPEMKKDIEEDSKTMVTMPFCLLLALVIVFVLMLPLNDDVLYNSNVMYKKRK